MCCNTFPFDICNMFVLFRRQDGESAPKGSLSPLLLGGCGWISGWLPGSGRGPIGIHPANPLISGSFLAIFVCWRAKRGASLATGLDFWEATRKPPPPEPA